MSETIISQSLKEHYGFTYREHFDAMFRRNALFVKDGDANDTKVRWTNADIAGANEAGKKVPLHVFTDLEGIKRDHDYRKEVAKVFPQSHPELDGAGSEWHAVPLALIPNEHIDHYKTHRDSNFNLAIRPIVEWLQDQHAKIFARFGTNNTKRKVSLRDLQKKIIKRIIKLLKKHGVDSTIIAELAPRFGKTIFFLSLFLEISKEYGHKVMLVPAYWLPAIASFKKETAKWRDYQDMVFVDTIEDSNWQHSVEHALNDTKLVVVGVSLYPAYDDFVVRNKWIHDYTETILVVGDEADYGSHTNNQQEKMEYLFANKQVTFIPSSGTNIERMSKGAGDNVVDVVAVPYALVEQSGDAGIVKREMFQMYVSNRIQELVKDYSDEDRPAWSKMLEKAMANSQFLVGFFKAVYGYSPEYGMSLDEAASEEIVVSMIFANMTKEAMAKLKKLLDSHLTDHHIVVINGDEMTGRDAEELAKDALRQVKYGWINKKKVIFLNNAMASRSFSVGDIQATLFLKDGGSVDTFIQQALRVVTPLDQDETILVSSKSKGYIFSFSFDQNKERKDQLMLLYEAKRVVEYFDELGLPIPGATKPGIVGGVQYVLNSMNLSSIGFLGEGRLVKENADSVMADFEDDEKVLRVAGIITNRAGIMASPELMELLLKCPSMKPDQKKKVQAILEKGKSKGGAVGGNFSPDDKKTLEKEVLGAINSIIYSSTTVLQFSNFQGHNFRECLENISNNIEADTDFQRVYNITSAEMMKFLPYLPVELLDMSVHNAQKASQ
jgi:uncharacterized phage-like protein YoqJ